MATTAKKKVTKPAGLTPAQLAAKQRAQDEYNFKFFKPAMQAQQDARNAPYFAAYAAAHPGQAAGAPAAATAAPGPAAPAKAQRVDPFSTGAEMQAAAQYHAAAAQQIAGINQGVDDMRTGAIPQLGYTDAAGVFHQGTIDKEAVVGRASTDDNAAARGLGQSSIRDGALFDIEAQRVVKRGYLEDAIKRAETNATTNKGIISSGVADFDKGTLVTQAGNAAAINNTIEPDAPPAAAPAPPTPVAAAAARAAAGKPVVTGSTPQPGSIQSPPRTGGLTPAQQRAQDEYNFKFFKPAMQAQQDARNAARFPQFAAAMAASKPKSTKLGAGIGGK